MQNTQEKKITFLQEYTDSYPAQLTEQYELLECLSHKEKSETILARKRVSGEKVVIKCYYCGHPFFEGREPIQMQELDFDGIPAYKGEYCNETMRCTLREYVEGVSLYEWAEQPFSAEFVRNIGVQLCRILEYLHGQTPPVIHRDIKPQNIILRENGRIALIDFEISRLYKEEVTSDTFCFGTRDFAPPEQYGFGQTDSRADIYSMGMLLTWMLTQKTEKIDKPAGALEKILKRCTAFAPKERFSSARKVRRRLEKLNPAYRRRYYLGGAVALSAAVLCGTLGGKNVLQHKGDFVFHEPLVEEAVRMTLKCPEGIISEEDLQNVTELYIMADTAASSEEEYFRNMTQWQADGMVRGELTSLEDLKFMPNLRIIRIGGNKINNISDLENLEQLEMVDFAFNQISDVSALANKPNLCHVGLSHNEITDISPLAECPALNSLDLRNAGSFDGQPLERMDGFSLLDITADTDAWKYLSGKTVRQLKLGSPGQKDLSCIRDMTHIEELYIYWSDITDISAIEGRTDIIYLNMSGCLIEDLSPVFTLPGLQTVTVSVKIKADMEEQLGEHGGNAVFTVEYTD